MDEYNFEVNVFDTKTRLDKFLVSQSTGLTRSRLQALIESGFVRVDGKERSCSYLLRGGEHISLLVPPPEDATPQPEDIPLDIIYEDEDLIVINKPVGLVVHPAPGHAGQTLVNALLSHCGNELSGIGGVKRPGIVHRLDKGTSGLMVVAKNDKTHQSLMKQFEKRTISRKYLALVWGTPAAEGRIEGNIGRSTKNRKKMALVEVGGKHAVTNFKIRQYLSKGISLLECSLETGRTHQIRVHLSSKGFPIINDPLYGRTPRGMSERILACVKENVIESDRPLLHAFELSFIHPKNKKVEKFTCDLPEDIKNVIACLQNNEKSRGRA